MERLKIDSAYITKTFDKGTIVTVETPDLIVHSVSDVAAHEAKHAAVARKVKKVTIEPTSEYGGATWVENPDDIAAIAAPDADGHSGTGHDMFLAEVVHGVDRNTARAAGRAELSKVRDEVYEFAVILDHEKTVGQSALDSAFQKADEKRHGVYELTVEITPAGEKTQIIETKSINGEVKISDLLKAA